MKALNIYSPVDQTAENIPSSEERVFISHRNADKPLAVAIAALLEAVGVHYWFDRDDEDLRRAAALGLAGDLALVHGIERGIRHSSRVLGLLSINTRGSWWVPYEIGASQALGRSASFLVLESIRSMEALPEYVRLAANYWSIDELVRWAMHLRGIPMNASPASIPEPVLTELEKFVPRQPPAVSVAELSSRALTAIDRLAKPETWEALRLSSPGRFDWLPTHGGLIRELAYDLLAPLAFFQQNERQLINPELHWLRLIYRSLTQHYEFAALDPRLTYSPEEPGWRTRRYLMPASSWLQGLRFDQLVERLNRFCVLKNLSHNPRLVTKEEFKAEFDRARQMPDEQERRSLGVLVNPLFGFTPTTRPVYWRILAFQQRCYQEIVNQQSRTMFDSSTTTAVSRFFGPMPE